MHFLRRPLLVLGLFQVAIGVPAVAQTLGPSSYAPACDDSRVTKTDRDRAHTVFLSGKQFLEESNYEKAISYFKDAYSIDCSVHGILPIIATAYERKGDKREAIHALEEYQKRAPAAADHEVIERRIRNLKDQVTQEQPTASAVPSLTPSATSSAPTPPIEAAPAASASSSLAPSQAPPEERKESGSHTAGPWILAGAGAAVLAGGVVSYAVGASKVSSAESSCGSNHVCPRSVGSGPINDGNTGRSLELVGGIVGGVGAAAVVLGLVWHFAEHPRSADTGPTTAVKVQPIVAPSYGGLAIGGAFH
jgi:hypothetical protein